MQPINFSKQRHLMSCLILLLFPSVAAPSKVTEPAIQQLYYILKRNQSSTMSSRIEIISSQFLGKPYLLGALGEGHKGRYNQMPLYRTDAFDCETFVDTVLALALAGNQLQFKQCINQVRYQDGNVSFIHRNHFTCLDWNKNNQLQGFVKDITQTIQNKNQQSVAAFASARIDKPSWYNHFSIETLKLGHLDPIEKKKRLVSLKSAGQKLSASTSIIPYVPLSVLFDNDGHANYFIFNQIPHAAILEIIRPNWDLTKEIGTHLNVSHLGFVIKNKGRLFFREASSTQHQVVDVPLINYLSDARKSPTIKGINLQVVLSQPCYKRKGRVNHIAGSY